MAISDAITGSNVTRANGIGKRIRRHYNLYLMLLPVLLGFIVFRYLPLFGLIAAFKDIDISEGFLSGPWVGLRNFMDFFSGFFFWRVVRNTFLLGALAIVFGFPAPIILALSLNEVKSTVFKRVAQTITYLPHFISTVVLVGILYQVFGYAGIVNDLLEQIFGYRIQFVGSSEWFRTLYIGSGIWQGVGWGSIIYLATLASLDVQLYEAAIVDGANRWQLTRYITLPGLFPTIRILLILSIADLFNVGFEKVYLMYNPGIYETADVISTYVYRTGIVAGNYSYATAVGLFESLVAITLLAVAHTLARRITGEGLW